MRARVNIVEASSDGGMFRAANPPISSINLSNDGTEIKFKVEFAINVNRYLNEGGKLFLEIRRPYDIPANQAGFSFQTVSEHEKSLRDLASSKSAKIIDLSNIIGIPLPGPYRYTGNDIVKTNEQLPSNNPDDIIMSTEFLRDCVYRHAVDPATLSSQGKFVDTSSYRVNSPVKKSTNNFKPDRFDTHYRSSTHVYEKIETFIESDYQKYETGFISLTPEDFSSASVYEFSCQNSESGFIELLEIDMSDSIPRIQEILGISSQTSTASYELYFKSFNGYGSLSDYQNSQQLIGTFSNSASANNSYNTSERIGFYRISTSRNGKQISTNHKPASVNSGGAVVSGAPLYANFYIDERRNVIVVKNLPHKAKYVRAIATYRNNVIKLGESQIMNDASPVEINISTFGLIDRRTYSIRLEFEVEFSNIIRSLEIDWRYFKLPPRGVSIFVENLGLGRITRTNNLNELGDIANRFKVTTSFLNSSRNDSTTADAILQSANIPELGITSGKNEYNDILTFRVKTYSFSPSASMQEVTPEVTGSSSGGFVNWDDVNFTTNDRLYGKVYSFSLGMRDPNALQTNQKGYKWGKAGGFQRASLPSRTTSRESVMVPFEEIEAGSIFTIFEEGNIALTNPPVIARLSVSIIPKSNLIEWEFQGSADTTFLDHVQVYGTYAGTEKLLGTSFKESFYRDEELWNLPGDITYRIVPVYNDYTFGASATIEFRAMESTIPRIVMRDFANGEDSGKYNPIVSVTIPSLPIEQEDLLAIDVTGQSEQAGRSFTPVFETLSIDEINQLSIEPEKLDENKRGAMKQVKTPRFGTPTPRPDILKSGNPSLKDILNRETRISSDITDPATGMLGRGTR